MKTITFTILITLACSAHAVTGFFKYEINNGGTIKQCVYDVLGSDYVINVKSYAICPITIQV